MGKRGQLGSIILVGCVITLLIHILLSTKVSMTKSVIQDYKENSFTTLPYLAALSLLNTSACDGMSAYKLMSLAAEEGNETVHVCNSDVNVRDELFEYHKEFACAFGTNYYLIVEGITDEGVVPIISLPSRVWAAHKFELVAQMPIPLSDGNVSRVVLIQGQDYDYGDDCE